MAITKSNGPLYIAVPGHADPGERREVNISK
jgi:hypothetical protein